MLRRDLQQMVVVITGASAGIGKALAEKLAARGAKLALAARRMDRLTALCATLGGDHLAIGADVSKREDCERIVTETVRRFGRIDTLVCNAGFGMVKSVVDTTPEEMQQIFAANLFGTTDCIRAAVPVMRDQQERNGWRGQIMIVSSAAARRGLPYFGPYAATKAAQLSISEALRVELMPFKIAVTSVHPVGTNTDFFDTAQQLGTMQMNAPGKGEIRQTPATVARKMINGMEKPTQEIWPMRASRWMLSFSTLTPKWTDRVMNKYRGEMKEKATR